MARGFSMPRLPGPSPITPAKDQTARQKASGATAAAVSDGRVCELVQAIFLMRASGFFFSCLNAEIRYLSAYLHPFETAFFRNLFGLVFMVPWLFRAGLGGLRTSRLKLYLFRTTLGLISMLCWFTALALLPLSQAVALSFTAPLFATVGAALFLH